MKHLKVFLTHEDYLDFTETSDYVLPNVSYCVNPESDNEPLHPDVHYNPQLRITYHTYPELAAISTKSMVPDTPKRVTINIINSNLTLSDYIKDITFNGHTVPVELFNSIIRPVGEDCTILLTLKDVAWISPDMFRNCKLITKVVIPDSVDTISSRAFYGCINLKTIDLGKVTSINNYAFCGCDNLSESSRELINNINPTALSCEK